MFSVFRQLNSKLGSFLHRGLNKMKRRIGICFGVLFLLAATSFGANNVLGNRELRRSGKDSIKQGDLGVAVRAIYGMPSGLVANGLNSSVGANMTLADHNSLNFISLNLSLELAADYVVYTAKAGIGNSLTTLNPKLLLRYDVKIDEIPGMLYLEAGGGVSMETLNLLGVSYTNNDPLYQGGIGYETTLVDNLNFQAVVSYVYVPEIGTTGATRDGAYLNFSAGLNFEFSLGGGKTK